MKILKIRPPLSRISDILMEELYYKVDIPFNSMNKFNSLYLDTISNFRNPISVFLYSKSSSK